MKYLNLFENFEESDEIKERIEEIYYEFPELKVDVVKKVNYYKVIITPKVLSTPDKDRPDMYARWNYFENKGELNYRIRQMFKYMIDAGFYPSEVRFDKIKDDLYINDDFFLSRNKQFFTVCMSRNTPLDMYTDPNVRNFAQDEQLMKIEIKFYENT